jgi:thiamine biosynthesis lipoprotein
MSSGNHASSRPSRCEGIEQETETARAWQAMGTLVEVRVPDLPAMEAIEAIRAVRRRIERIEASMTIFREESPLVAFNRGPSGGWMVVPDDLAHGVVAATEGAEAWHGAFDPTVAPMMRAWGLYEMQGRTPGAPMLRDWRRRADWRAIEVDLPNRRLRRHDGRVQLDLGGVGKGIAVDEALAVLDAAGSRGALVNLGGSIGVLGAPPGRPEGWPVAIAHPREPGRLWAEFALARGHMATSGDYERSVVTSGGRKHHLLDPVSGEPTRGPVSVTVWSATGKNADVDSTGVFITLARNAATTGDIRYLALDLQGGLLRERCGGAPDPPAP